MERFVDGHARPVAGVGGGQAVSIGEPLSNDPIILAPAGRAPEAYLMKTRPGGLEPPTVRFEACYSIQLSYGREGVNLYVTYRCTVAGPGNGPA